MSTYLTILIISFAVPFAFSFDKKVAFYKKWKYLFPALLIIAAIFILWDVIFTRNLFWGFNNQHISEIRIFNLPLEECLFFIIIPYNMIFVSEVLRAYFKTNPLKKIARPFTIILAGLLLIISLAFYDNPYTFITFTLAGIYLFAEFFIFRSSQLHWYYISYLVVLIPFLIVNGILTGTFLEEEVVWYSADAIIGLRVFTIPVEDFIYNLLLFFLNLTLYEYFKKKFHTKIKKVIPNF